MAGSKEFLSVVYVQAEIACLLHMLEEVVDTSSAAIFMFKNKSLASNLRCTEFKSHHRCVMVIEFKAGIDIGCLTYQIQLVHGSSWSPTSHIM